jgi:hypothetical protein
MAGITVADAGRSCEIHPNIPRRCRRDFRDPESAFADAGRSSEESWIPELRRQIEHHAKEIDKLKQCVPRRGSALVLSG